MLLNFIYECSDHPSSPPFGRLREIKCEKIDWTSIHNNNEETNGANISGMKYIKRLQMMQESVNVEGSIFPHHILSPSLLPAPQDYGSTDVTNRLSFREDLIRLSTEKARNGRQFKFIHYTKHWDIYTCMSF